MKKHSIFMFMMSFLISIASYNIMAEEISFYVSVDGSDSQLGTHNKPFGSIQKAMLAVQEYRKNNDITQISVILRGGTYYLPNGLMFRAADGGSKKCKVIYKNYAGESPVLIGGVKLQEWQKYKDGIYVSNFPENKSGYELFENGTRMQKARTPKKGYYKMQEQVEIDGKLAFKYTQEDFDPSDWDLSCGIINYWPYENWSNNNSAIHSIDKQSHTIVVEREKINVHEGNRYYLFNILSLLTESGECVVNESKNNIFVWPKESIDSTNLVLSTCFDVVRVEGNSNEKVQNLHFEGLKVGICERNAIDFSYSRNCSVNACLIENAGDTGVYIHQYTQGITVSNCEIRYNGQHGVGLQGGGIRKESNNHHHVIKNNHIYECGKRLGHGNGVYTSHSGYNQIINNHIHDMPRYAVTVKGNRYKTIEGKIPGMTWDNRYDYMQGRNNYIAFNNIHNVNTDSQDTGAIESWGSGRDNVIDNNLIYDSGNEEFNLQSGIYLDDQADYWTVTNNIIYGIYGKNSNQCVYAKGIGNHFENNIFVGNIDCDRATKSFYMAEERCDNHKYLRNIFYFPIDRNKIGRFGWAVGGIHERDTTLLWNVNIPKTNKYNIWMRYSASNMPNFNNMGGKSELKAGTEPAVLLINMPDTGDWEKFEWKLVGEINLNTGEQKILWKNIEGGGFNMDAIAFSDDPNWKPAGDNYPETKPGYSTVLIQAESYAYRNGEKNLISTYAYDFVNYSDDRFSESDYNVFYSPQGRVVTIGSPAGESMEKWKKLHNNRFDQHSVEADPMFKDAANHDYSLKAGSPALKLGFRQIDQNKIGLTDEFPKWLSR